MTDKKKRKKPRWTKAHTKMLREVMAESVHTAFRKGCLGGDRVWHEIYRLDNAEWGKAVEWMVWAIDVSLRRGAK